VSNSRKKGLGKGMGSLIDGYSIEGIFSSKLEKSDNLNNDGNIILHVSLNQLIINENQPRKHFNAEALNELSQSIKEQGILQPILVEEVENNKFSIVAGERRYRAAKLAGLERVPVIVKKFNDISRLEVALIENIQREDLNPIEEANAFYYLLKESGITQEELASKVGKSRSAISNSIRLLQLPKQMQEGLVSGEYSSGHARALLSLVNPADKILLLEKLTNDNISVREAEKIAKALNNGHRDVLSNKKAKNEKKKIYSPELEEVQDKFIQAVGNKVELKGDLYKGKIVLSYNSEKELEDLFQKLSNGMDLFEI
jgi:ParB family chromosome partitioning protein